MNRPLFALTLLLATADALAAAASEPAPGRAAAAVACERAAQGTLRDTRGTAASATFDKATSLIPGPADAGEITLRGSGQVRTPNGVRPFSYSCTYDTRNNAVAGVVLRDLDKPDRAMPARAVEPDLSQISPTVCESAAANALKRRWPAVAQIAFNADTRQLSQEAGGPASLRGQGQATPSLGGPATHFSYDCALDPRNGRVLKITIGD
jgi:hypothetical protein